MNTPYKWYKIYVHGLFNPRPAQSAAHPGRWVLGWTYPSHGLPWPFPDTWKLAKSVPITKEEDPEAIPANNRPISLLPILSKVIERLAQKQFSDFFTRKKKLSVHQSSYKWHNSTETALVYVNDQLLKAIEEKTVSLLVLLDMCTVAICNNHSTL